jgi:hypothetical protein
LKLQTKIPLSLRINWSFRHTNQQKKLIGQKFRTRSLEICCLKIQSTSKFIRFGYLKTMADWKIYWVWVSEIRLTSKWCEKWWNVGSLHLTNIKLDYFLNLALKTNRDRWCDDFPFIFSSLFLVMSFQSSQVVLKVQ